MWDKIVESCRYLLKNYPEAELVRNYLDTRISAKNQELFQFGYFPNANNIEVLSDLVGEDILLQNELFRNNTVEDSLCPRQLKICYFENHPLVIPYYDAYGNVVGLSCRSLFNDEQRKKMQIVKYKNTKFKKGNCLFGLSQNKKSIEEQNSVYIVEGQFDVIKAVEIGMTNIVGIGNNNITAYQFSVISRYTNNIFMLLDNDEGGEKGRKNAISKYGTLANFRNFYIPENYKDIDEYITSGHISSLSDLALSVQY